MTSVTEEYQDGENSYCEFFGLVPFLQLAIHILLSTLFSNTHFLCSSLWSGDKVPQYKTNKVTIMYVLHFGFV
jgi:hypothetical protein